LPQVSLADFRAQVDALVGEAGGFVEIAVAKPDGTMLYETNASESMESASLYKLAVMVELYRQRDAGMLTFDDGIELQPYHFAEGEDAFSEDEIGTVVDVGTLLNAMITLSSNVASTALLELVGNDNINATMASLGLTGTEIRWMPGPWDLEAAPYDSTDEPAPEEPVDPDASEDTGVVATRRSLASIPAGGVLFDERADNSLNVTTAADMATLFHLLLAGQVVSPEASHEMLDLLAEQQINDRLPAYLPDGAVVAHKTGNLDGLVHDAGVVYTPAGPVIIAVLTEDVDEGVADDLMARVALLTWQMAG
jgi:beta-lactamase class A